MHRRHVLHSFGHKCAIPARFFFILSWDRKVSRYFGIVLSLILNLENLGIDIGIVIEFRLLRYWYRYWYPFSNSEVLELILALNSKTFSIGIVIDITAPKLNGKRVQGMNAVLFFAIAVVHFVRWGGLEVLGWGPDFAGPLCQRNPGALKRFKKSTESSRRALGV